MGIHAEAIPFRISRSPISAGSLPHDSKSSASRGSPYNEIRSTGVKNCEEATNQDIRCLAGCGKTISAQKNFDGLHVRDKRRTPSQDAQTGFPLRSSFVKRRSSFVGVRMRYPHEIRFTIGASRVSRARRPVWCVRTQTENKASGLFQYPVMMDWRRVRTKANRSEYGTETSSRPAAWRDTSRHPHVSISRQSRDRQRDRQ